MFFPYYTAVGVQCQSLLQKKQLHCPSDEPDCPRKRGFLRSFPTFCGDVQKISAISCVSTDFAVGLCYSDPGDRDVRQTATAVQSSSPGRFTPAVSAETTVFGVLSPQERSRLCTSSGFSPSLTITTVCPLCMDSRITSGRCSSPIPTPGGGPAVPTRLT